MSVLAYRMQMRAEGIRRRFGNWLSFMIHLLVMALLFLLPEVIITLGSPHHTSVPPSIYVKAAIYAGVFYLNFYYIIDRTLLRNGTKWRFVIYNVVLLAAGETLLALNFLWFDKWMFGSPHCSPVCVVPPVSVAGNLVRDLTVMALTVALSVAIKVNDYRLRLDRKTREMESLRRDMELMQLHNQLNPHFLFNTLNGIYALVDIDRERAKASIHRLSKMLRYMLHDCHSAVTVAQEIKFLESYIELMGLRLPEDYPVEVDLSAGNGGNLRIQPLMFLNIVENAFKFGASATGQRRISIKIGVKGNTVDCVAENTYRKPAQEAAERSGIGMENLRRRLELRYPGSHTLDVCDDGEVYRVHLTITIQ